MIGEDGGGDTMGRTTIISIVTTNVVVLCYVIYHKNFLFGDY